MARKICGESSLKVGARFVRLRLDIGTMMDLEDHFDMGLVPFLSKRLPEFRLGDMAVLYAAMTGTDFADPVIRKKAGAVLIKVGLLNAASAISSCLEQTLNPDSAGGESLGKPDQTNTVQTKV